MNPAWLQTEKKLTSLRTPSCLLLNDKKEFEAYGYEAERLYLELAKEGRQNKYFYFRRFKPKLYGIKVHVIILTKLILTNNNTDIYHQDDKKAFAFLLQETKIKYMYNVFQSLIP